MTPSPRHVTMLPRHCNLVHPEMLGSPRPGFQGAPFRNDVAGVTSPRSTAFRCPRALTRALVRAHEVFSRPLVRGSASPRAAARILAQPRVALISAGTAPSSPEWPLQPRVVAQNNTRAPQPHSVGGTPLGWPSSPLTLPAGYCAFFTKKASVEPHAFRWRFLTFLCGGNAFRSVP